MKLKFLIIDDELDITEVLKIYVEKYFDDSEIRSFINPFDAISSVDEGFSPDIIILDLNMPQMHGLELVKKLLAVNPQFNIVIYSGDIGQVELVSNVELGIKGILEKPSAPEELRDEVNRILAKDKNKNDNFTTYDLVTSRLLETWNADVYVVIGKNKYVKLFCMGDEIDHQKIEKMLQRPNVQYAIPAHTTTKAAPVCQYTPIDIITIKITKTSPCDIFSKHAGDYKKIISQSTPILKEFLNILIKKNIKQLHVEEQNEKFFTVIPENTLILRINDSALAREERVQMLIYYSDLKLDELYENPNEKTIFGIEFLSESIAKYLNDDKGAFIDLLNVKAGHDAKAHVLKVATLSTAILQYFEASLHDANTDKKIEDLAKKFIYTPAMKKNIVLAGVLHDLENAFPKTERENLQIKNRSEAISQTEKLLSQIKSIPALVIEMIEQHQERFDGSGPKKLLKSKINLYAQILIVADQYQIYLTQGKTPQLALMEMFREKAKYNEVLLQVLKNVLT
jgi:response regulator RpfG family c-di-GMP phosphodiesterase